MRILVWGAGAVGLALGALLQQAGHQVWFRARPQAMQALADTPFQLTGLYGEHRLWLNMATDPQLPQLEPELILLTVKAHAVEQAAQQLAALGWRCPVLHFQNGIGSYQRLRAYIPDTLLYTGMIIIGFQRHSVSEVEISVFGGPICVGQIGQPISPQVEALRALLAETGIESQSSGQMEQQLWRKLLYNSALNPLAALLGVHYGALLTSACLPLLQGVVREAFEVAAKAGVELPWSHWQQYVELLCQVQIPATFAHQPSMLADLKAGRPTEIDQLNGAICQLGAQYQVSTPVNQSLVWLIKAREQLVVPLSPSC